jgi:hypothetical protein
LPLLTYLNDGPDLLELAVKEASYPIPFNFRPVSSGMNPIVEQMGNIKKLFIRFPYFLDNEVGVCMEILFSRLLYVATLSRAASGWVSELRNARN